jgi:NADPH:quinone reductase-like Zn-dependent oxidoreductase
MGCHAEYRCVAATGPVAKMPPNLSYVQAAALCFGGSTMLDFYRRGALSSGERVLVNGASGGVGTAAVQLAKHFGAHVTAVCSTGNLELVQSIGADRVIDYTREDFARNGSTYDVIVDTVGNAPFSRSGSALARGGRLLMLVAGLPDLLKVPWTNLRSGKTVVAGPCEERVEYVQQLADLAAAGHFLPVIDRRFPLEKIVDAHRYVDQGRKRGNVGISLV